MGERVELVRQREDEVVVGNGQELGAARGQPAFLGAGLAFGAVTIAAGVVDVALLAAGLAPAQFSPERSRAAMLDGAQRPMLLRTEPVRGAEGCAVRTDDVGELEPARALAA